MNIDELARAVLNGADLSAKMQEIIRSEYKLVESGEAHIDEVAEYLVGLDSWDDLMVAMIASIQCQGVLVDSRTWRIGDYEIYDGVVTKLTSAGPGRGTVWRVK